MAATSNGKAILIGVQAFLCLLEAYLISKISLIGKIGIAMFYKQYRFLRSGWKTFLLLFAVQLLLIGVLHQAKKLLPARKANYAAAIFLILAILGLWGTYYDFQYTFSHRLLKEKFHLGFYLFWLGWMGTCVYYLVARPGKPDAAITLAEEAAAQMPV
jgi:hypothetical protein